MNDRTTPSPLALGYENPRTAPRPRRVPPFSLAAFLTTGAIVLLSYGIIELVIPRMESLYKDFGIKLPAATQMLLDVARFGIRYEWIPAMSLPLVVALLVPHVLPGRQENE